MAIDADHVGLDAFVEREGEALTRAMKQRGDLVSELLRFHLLTECQLERLIQALLPRGERLLENGVLGYVQKLAIIDALDVLPEGVSRSLRALHQLRQRYSGQVDPTISTSDVTSFGRPLGAAFTRSRNQAGQNFDRLANATFGLLYGHLIRAVHRAEYPPEVSTELDHLADAASLD